VLFISFSSLIFSSADLLGADLLGVDLLGAERPQGIVPAGVWQSAQSLGAWTLVGCTVAPGFEFAHFEIAAPGQLPDLGGELK
jgi:predicted cupin superfamily sugar epimerase